MGRWPHIIFVQSLSRVWLFVTPWPGFPVLHYLSEFAHSCPLSQWTCNHLILCRPLLLPSIFPNIRVFSNESALRIRWPKLVEIQLEHEYSASSEYSGLISFRIDWFDLLAVQRTLKSLLQLHNSKASVLQCSAFFMVQLSYCTWLLEKP